MTYTFNSPGVIQASTEREIQDIFDQMMPPPTEEQNLKERADILKKEMFDVLVTIDITLVSTPPGTAYDNLVSLRNQVYNLRNMPGPFEEVNAAFVNLIPQVQAAVEFKFPFEL